MITAMPSPSSAPSLGKRGRAPRIIITNASKKNRTRCRMTASVLFDPVFPSCDAGFEPGNTLSAFSRLWWRLLRDMVFRFEHSQLADYGPFHVFSLQHKCVGCMLRSSCHLQGSLLNDSTKRSNYALSKDRRGNSRIVPTSRQSTIRHRWPARACLDCDIDP